MDDKLTVKGEVRGDVELSINMLRNEMKFLVQSVLYIFPSHRWEHLGGVVYTLVHKA